jgi:predicted dehydrogenase
MTKYKALIIGAGSIGALKPSEFDSPESNHIYTHAHACYSHPNIELVGIIDVDQDKALQAAKKWNTKDYTYIDEFYSENERSDIVIVAVDTTHHYNVIKELIEYKPKVIICEKPFCLNQVQASIVSEWCRVSGINLIINYTRSFVPELKQLSDDLKNGVYGEIYNFTLRYSRGLLREASHAFHWCLQTFGCIYFSSPFYNIQRDSPMKGDYSALFVCAMPKCPNVSFIPIGLAYSTYNADIYTEKGRIELSNNWKTIRFHTLANSTYGDYKATGLLFEDKQTQLDQALTFLLDHAIENIDNSSDNTNALNVHEHLKLNKDV